MTETMMKEYPDGTREWYRDGKLHRLDRKPRPTHVSFISPTLTACSPRTAKDHPETKRPRNTAMRDLIGAAAAIVIACIAVSILAGSLTPVIEALNAATASPRG